jgi:hypothetical protein
MAGLMPEVNQLASERKPQPGRPDPDAHRDDLTSAVSVAHPALGMTPGGA